MVMVVCSSNVGCALDVGNNTRGSSAVHPVFLVAMIYFDPRIEACKDYTLGQVFCEYTD